MVFDDTSTNQGIVQEVYFGVNANSNSYPKADLTRHANLALDEMTSIAIENDGVWQFHDTNYTTQPVGDAKLFSNQPDYTFNEQYLTIENMYVLPEGATEWNVLKPVDKNDPATVEELNSMRNTSGTPEYYDIIGKIVYLYPKPNYTQEASLKADFQKKASYFTASDTTKEPGFPQHLHKFVPTYCKFAYAEAKNLPKKKDFWEMLQFERERLKKHFSRRSKFMQSQITPEEVNSI